MSPELQAYIDSKIPRELQKEHARDVGMIRGGREAAMKHFAGTQDARRVIGENPPCFLKRPSPPPCPPAPVH